MSNQKRMTADCRKMPSDSHCDVYMSGGAEHVLEAAVAHAVADHGHKDTPELRSQIKALLEEEKVKV